MGQAENDKGKQEKLIEDLMPQTYVVSRLLLWIQERNQGKGYNMIIPIGGGGFTMVCMIAINW